jgi:hypothetical protein
MKIEFVDFYPFQNEERKNKKILGTCHIYIEDFDMDIRGIRVITHKKGFIFKMPYGFQIDPCTKTLVHFPFISFTNRAKLQDIFDFLFKNRDIIQNKLNEIQRSSISNGKCSNSNTNPPRIVQKQKNISTHR